MLTEVKAGGYTIRGASLGGMYTALHVPELDALFDVGIPVRSACGVRNLFLSHPHVDHLGALVTFLGMRGLTGVKTPLRVFLPAGVEGGITDSLQAISRLHRWPLTIETVPMSPGDTFELRRDLSVRAIRTYHPVPCLGFSFFEPVSKLKAEFADLPGREIGRLRKLGAPIFDHHERNLFAYATDTLPKVLDTSPEIFEAKTLVLECTFLDERKTVAKARAGCHIHLDELLPRLEHCQNEALVLMHFSQLYKPREVEEILDARCPPDIRERIIPFVPTGPRWWI
ncbi:MAG: ribonuclease Z [Bradymonadia bacterium]|jgi:ribonuclease Z